MSMRPPGMAPEPDDPQEVYMEFSADLKRRLDLGRVVLGQGLELLSDLDKLNQVLAQKGRPDLAITEPAEMDSIDQPSDITNFANNFSFKFAFYSGWLEAKEADATVIPQHEPIIATEQEIAALEAMPLFRSSAEVRDFKKSEQLPCMANISHATKPAFTRMLILFPEFTKNLVLGISDPTNKHQHALFAPDLFVAYQLMSHLVDINDLYVKHDGHINSWYLCA